MGFWGVILESGKRYSQTVDESYHLTMASLEPPSGDGKKPSKYVSVMVEHQNTEFMICTLEPERNLQIPLDHMFVAGEEVTFFLNGEGTVHLTGYLVPDDYDDFDEDLDEEDEDEEASDEDSDSVQLVSAKRKNEALESSPEAVGKKAKVDLKLAKDSPNKTSKVEEKESINALKKKNEEKNFNKNLNDNKVSKIVPQNNKVESDESEEEDDSDEDEEESDQDMDESLGLIDKEAVEADDSDDEEEDEESSDESDDESPQQKSSPFKGKPNKQNEQNKNKNNQQNQQQNKSPQNQQQNKSPQNQQQNKQKQFGSGQKGGFQGNQQKGQFQKGQWNQSGQKNQFGGGQNQNQKGGWQQKKQFGGQNQGRNQQGGQQQNSPNWKGKQNPNFKGQQRGSFGTPNTPNFNQNKGENKEQKTNASLRKLEKGLIIEDVRVGNGPEAKKGKFIHVNYIGRLPNNKEFDRSSNKPFSFKLGRGEVIKGWDIGLEGMKVGGKRKITVPSNMGYGNRPVGQIPANSALHFEVELKSVT